MTRIDENNITRGIVEVFKSGRGQGTGYGFVRGRGRNAGKAFFHINARVAVKVDQWGFDSEARIESTWVSSQREPKEGDEIVIFSLEHDPKGLKAEAWCFADEYEKALRERDDRNSERVRRVGAKERLEADIAQAGWPALSLVPTTGHEGDELLGGRYHNRLIAKKDGRSNTVGAMVQQIIKRDGVEVQRSTELPAGVRYIERAYYLNPPKPEHLYVERAEAVVETEAQLAASFEQLGIAVEFPERVLYVLGGQPQELALDIEAGKASYKLVSPRFGEQVIGVSFSPEKGHIDAYHRSFVHRAYLSGFIAPEVRNELAQAFAPAARASRKPFAVYHAEREIAVLDSLRKGWSAPDHGYEIPPARMLDLLEEGVKIEYDSYRSSYSSGWVQAIFFGHRSAECESFQIHQAESEKLRELDDVYQQELQQEGRRSMFSRHLLELDHGDPCYQATLRQAVTARILADREELRQRYAKAMEQELDFSAPGYGTMMEEWYAENLPQELPEELTARLTGLREWWNGLDAVEARAETAIIDREAAARQMVEDARSFVASAELAVAHLKEEYGREEDLAGFCDEELRVARYAFERTRYAEVVSKAQTVLDACVQKQAEIDARRAQQARGEIWLNVRVSISTESRTHTKAWAIRLDGSIMEPVEKLNSGGRKGRIYAHAYGDLPTDMLVISHEEDNYGYRKNERWRVDYLPRQITLQQHETVRHLLDDSRVYFAGREAGWDLSKVGNVTVTTSYSRDLMGEEREMYDTMCSNCPIEMSQWQVEREQVEYVGEAPHVTYVVWHRPRRPVPPRPAVVMATQETLHTTRVEQQEPALEEGQMEEAGNRHFRCLTQRCGRMERVGKSEWHAYQSGQVLTITCSGCGKTATVKK